MADLLRIQEPRKALSSAPRWDVFLELGFRPLYLAGCFWAGLSVLLWVFAPQMLTGPLHGVMWHAHEMLWAFVATIAVGFLLTAGANWTGVVPIKGPALGALCVLWLLGRIGLLVPDGAVFLFAVGCNVAFFLVAALALARAIYPTRSRRNYGLPLLVMALGVLDGLFIAELLNGDYATLMNRFNAGLLCMALIALLVARRVIPFFAMRAVAGLKIPMHTRSGHWQLAAGGLAVLFGLLNMPTAAAIALAVTGLIALVQLFAWKPLAVRQKPLLWVLYAGYAALGAGLLVAAAHAAGWVVRPAWPVHVIGVGGFSVLIIGMVTRTALGHLGRPLQTDRSMVISYWLVIAAAVLRLIALLPTPISAGALHASASLWAVAFALYLWRFFPMLIRPRVDQTLARPVIRVQPTR